MRNFLRDSQAGAKSNLTGIGNFSQEFEILFHEFIQNSDYISAQKLTRLYEDPYFDFAVSLGWHVQLKEVCTISS